MSVPHSKSRQLAVGLTFWLIVQLIAFVASPFLTRVVLRSAQWTFGGAMSPEAVWGDVALYFDYFHAVIAGRMPYRDFTVEYPPVALLCFIVPGLVTSSSAGYVLAFHIQMFAWSGVALFSVVRTGLCVAGDVSRVLLAVKWYSLYLIALSPIAFVRMDLVAAALSSLAVAAWISHKPRTGTVIAVVGAFAKYYPALVVLPALAWTRATGSARSFSVILRYFAVSSATALILWFAVVGPAALDTFTYHTGRGIQVESVYGGILILSSLFGSTNNQVVWDHKSYHLVAPGSSAMAFLSPFLQAALILLAVFKFKKGNCTEPTRCVAAVVAAFVVAGKVLSPQFMLWLLPLVPMAIAESGCRHLRWAFLGACITTIAVFPWSYPELLTLKVPTILLVNLRNLLLCSVFALLCFEPSAHTTDRTVNADDAGANGDSTAVARQENPHPAGSPSDL